MLDGINLKIYLALVVDYDLKDSEDNAEKKEQDKVKIKVSPQMDKWKDEHLPYARPFRLFTGRTEKSGISGTPMKDSYVWVFFSDQVEMRYPFYIADGSLNTKELAKKYYDSVQDKLDKLGDTSSIKKPELKYPDAMSFHYENGICVTYSKGDDPIISVYHPSGTYTIIDADGNLGAFVVGDFSLKTLKDEKGIDIHTKAQNFSFSNSDKVIIDVKDKVISMKIDNGGSMVIKETETIINDRVKIKT